MKRRAWMPRAIVSLAMIGWFCAPRQSALGAAQAVAPAPLANDVEAAAERLVDALAAGDFSAATERFDARMKTALPAAKLQQVWSSLGEKTGRFKQRLATRVETQSRHRLVFVSCEFERAILDAKAAFNDANEITELFFVPAERPPPKAATVDVPPDGISESAVTVGEGEWATPGTLSCPNETDGAPWPAVVLVHGSGSHDRDESIGPNKPFRDLAWGLAARGIAVLRYDKRTKTHGRKIARLARFTVQEETIDDALAAAALLRAHPRIDRARIFMLGHSLGGMLAPRIGKMDRELAGLIIVAGPTRPIEDLLLEQMRYVASLDGAVQPAEQAALDQTEKQIARIKALGPDDAASTTPIIGAPAAYWLDLRNYDPAAAARELPMPMLIIHGGRDYQVTTRDFEGWTSALAGRDNVATKLYPALNHILIARNKPSTPDEYLRPGRVDRAVIEDIADWIMRR